VDMKLTKVTMKESLLSGLTKEILPHSLRNKSLPSMTYLYFPQADGQVVAQNGYNGLG